MKFVPGRSIFLALWLGIGSNFAVGAQAFLPPAGKLNFQNQEQQALALSRDAAQLIRFGQTDLALPRARLAVQLAPKTYQTQAVLGSVYLRKEEYDKAIKHLQIAHSLNKNNASVLFSLGSAYLRDGNYNKAIDSINQGLSLPSEEFPINARFDLGNAYFLAKRYDDSIKEYQKVLNQDKNFWAATNNMGLVEYERDNIDRAIGHWQEAIKQAIASEDKTAEPRLALAVAFYVQGDQTQGLKLGEEALREDPRYGLPEFLKENLWGDKLLNNARRVLANPKLQELIKTSNISASPRRR
jgi:tetratricopeptide (TPR) repeat protein